MRCVCSEQGKSGLTAFWASYMQSPAWSRRDDRDPVEEQVRKVPDASQHYSVSALPTFLVFKDGKEVARIQGADEAGLRAALDKAGCPPPKNDIF